MIEIVCAQCDLFIFGPFRSSAGDVLAILCVDLFPSVQFHFNFTRLIDASEVYQRK